MATAIAVDAPADLQPVQKYDLLTSSQPAPDPTDGRYVRHCAQPLGIAVLNGWERPVRRVTITGLEIVFDKQDRYSLIREYGNKDDIQELYVVADSVVIATGLRFPQTNVFIVARELRFEGDGYIQTQPQDSRYRDAFEINGQNGATGGDITLFLETFTPTPGRTVKHFRTTGGKGQDPDEGGYETSPDRKDLRPITREDWDKVFTYKNRKVVHEEGVLWNDYVELPYPSFDDSQPKGEGSAIVYVEFSNTWWPPTRPQYSSQLPTKVVASAGQKHGPGTGGAAKMPGTPGLGGGGGNLKTNRPVTSDYCDLRGGPSGTPLTNVVGGPGGTPRTAVWLFFQGNCLQPGHPWYRKEDYHHSRRGPGIEKGPAALHTVGSDGAVSQLNVNGVMAVPVLVNLVLQFAKDCVALGHGDIAGRRLEPYVNMQTKMFGLELATLDKEASGIEHLLYQPLGLSSEVLGSSVALLQLHREARTLLERMHGYVDAFGNPPGWVPSLSLESAVAMYHNLVRSSMQEIYSAYYLEKIWQQKTNKAQALDQLIDLLTTQTKLAQEVLVKTRKGSQPAVDELAQLVAQLDQLNTDLAKRETELRKKADDETWSAEWKETLAAAFKIGGALIKALPLPEPYQSGARAVGSVFDITSTFINNGGDDTAFKALKKEVNAFASDENLTKQLTKDIDLDLQATNKEVQILEADAAECQRIQAAVEADDADLIKRAEEEKELMEKAAELQAAKLALQKKEGPESAVDVAELDKGITESKNKLAQKQREAAKIKAEQKNRKEILTERKKKLGERKAEREKTIKRRVGQLKNITTGIVTISETINQLTVSQSQLNTVYDKTLAKLHSTDDTFLSLMSQVKYLGQKKADIVQKIAQLSAATTDNEQVIAKNLVVINELRVQKAKSHTVLDPSVLTYIQSLGQDAHRDLRRFLYYVVRAYEYYTVRPWEQSYLTAQKTFEDLRTVLEPSDFSFDFEGDASGGKQKKLRSLLQHPETRKDGILSAEDLDLLKLVYQKPLRDMGKALADELIRGSGRLLGTAKPVTLRARDLQDLNARIGDPRRPNSIPVNLLKLRQIEATRERQRITNIRVVGVTCRRLGPDFPDQVILKFTLSGKSIVRADNRLYAFDPEVGWGEGSVALPGITFETDGGKRGPGWGRTTLSDGFEQGVLTDGALWQLDAAPQENLLSSLMMDYRDTAKNQLITLSQLRPGVYSDFSLTVDFQPAECMLTFSEIVLEITLEVGDANIRSVFVSVDTNVDLAIPIEASRKDRSGRGGGTGAYVGLYGDPGDLAKSPIRFSVPPVYGRYQHTGWLANGTEVATGDHAIDVSKSTYLTALYRDTPEALRM